LVLFILNNWTFIVELFQKGWEQIKKIWEGFSQALQSTWDGLKWIVSAFGGQDLIKRGEEQLALIRGDDLDSNNLTEKFEDEAREWKALASQMDASQSFSETPGDRMIRLYNEGKKNFEKNAEDSPFGQFAVPFSLGGLVSGPPGVDKVPAKLTSGEFVMSVRAVNMWGDMLAYMNALGNQGKGIKSPTSNDSLLSNNSGNMKNNIGSGGISTPLKEQKRVGDRSGMLMTQASYEMRGGTTVVMITGNDSPPQDSGEGGIKLLPLPMVNSGDYTLPFRTGLQKFG